MRRIQTLVSFKRNVARWAQPSRSPQEKCYKKPGYLISTFHQAIRFLCSSGNAVTIPCCLQCLRVQVARRAHCGAAAATAETLNREKSSSSTGLRRTCTRPHSVTSAVPQARLEAYGLSGELFFRASARASYAIQPARKHIIKGGKWQYKLVCLSPLQKFALHLQINTWSLQTLLAVFWQGNLGWYFCYMNACSQSRNRHSQCTWLLSYLTGTNKRCFHPTGCPVPPTLPCPL